MPKTAIEATSVNSGRVLLSRMNGRARRAIALLLAALALAACSETKPARFYLLSPIAEATSQGDVGRNAARNIALGVGPVDLPKYLDRLSIVRFATPNRLEISEFDRWGEPLNDNFVRVLGENLSAMVPGSRVVTYPFASGVQHPVDQQVLVNVTQFRVNPNNEVELRANWTVVHVERRRALASGAFATSEPVRSNEIEAVVAAMSRAVGALSQDIAAAIKARQKTR